MNRMLKRRKSVTAVAACLALGLSVAGVAGSADEPTNEERARQGVLERPAARSGAESPSNEKMLAKQGRTLPRAGASSSGGPSNDR